MNEEMGVKGRIARYSRSGGRSGMLRRWRRKASGCKVHNGDVRRSYGGGLSGTRRERSEKKKTDLI